MANLIDIVTKWNSTRLIAVGGAGYGVYALAVASLVPGPWAVGAIFALAAVYVIAETYRPTQPPKDAPPAP
jgi:hypothetical protein